MAGVAGLERQPLLTTESNYMKNKKCPYCNKVMIGGRGLANHIRFKHPGEPYSINAKKGVATEPIDTKVKITAVPEKVDVGEVIDALPTMNEATRPWYETALDKFESACHARSVLLQINNEVEGEKENETMALAFESTFAQVRGKLLRILSILDRKAKMADEYERELMS